MATVAAASLVSGCGAAEQASAPQPATTAEQASVRDRDRAARNNTPPLCPLPTGWRARVPTRVKAEAALRAAWEGVDCGATTPLVCPRPTAVPARPRVPTLEEAATTLRAAIWAVECDADAVLAAQMFLLALATGADAEQIRPDELDTANESLPVCTDDHLPDANVATTPEEAEAMPEPPPGTECDSRGGTLTLCQGGRMNCVMIGELTGPPTKTE